MGSNEGLMQMRSTRTLCRLVLSLLNHGRVRRRVRRKPPAGHCLAVELLEVRMLLSSVTADAYTIVGGTSGGQLSVLHQQDWDAEALRESAAEFEGEAVVQSSRLQE